MKDRSYVYWSLGTLGVPYDDIADLMGQAILNHKGFEPGYVQLPDLPYRLKYNSGIDGWDAWYEVEPA